MEQLRILLVDDRIDLTGLLQEILALEGWHTISAGSAEEALAALESMQQPPDVIVSDLGLPGMSGLAFLRAVRMLPGLESVPAIALTGYGEEADIAASRDAGYAGHLVKPVDADELIGRIRALAQKRRA